jgi:hypothetical protein
MLMSGNITPWRRKTRARQLGKQRNVRVAEKINADRDEKIKFDTIGIIAMMSLVARLGNSQITHADLHLA